MEGGLPDVEIPLPGILAAELGKMWVGVLINQAFDGVDPATGERRRREGICVAESARRLNARTSASRAEGRVRQRQRARLSPPAIPSN